MRLQKLTNRVQAGGLVDCRVEAEERDAEKDGAHREHYADGAAAAGPPRRTLQARARRVDVDG